MAGILNDRRTDKEKTTPIIGFVVMVDKFMSGWGLVPSRSLYALMARDCNDLRILTDNANARGEMRRVRFASTLPRLRDGDHLSVVGPSQAAPWYEEGGFRG